MMHPAIQDISRLKIESQDSYLDDDVLALLSDSDSDILETVEKTNFVDFLNDGSSMLAGFDKELST